MKKKFAAVSLNGMSESKDEDNSYKDRVVVISFYDVQQGKERNYPFMKAGKPILTIEFLGNTHTLTDVGEMLFRYYMGEKLGESLNSHIWRFTPLGNEYSHGTCLDANVPILSKTMQLGDQFAFAHLADMRSGPNGFILGEGDELFFSYDEGSPTYMITRIERIDVLSPLPCKEDYPRPVSGYGIEDDISRAKRARLSAIPVLTVEMDEAYPDMCKRLFQRGVAMSIGLGSGGRKGQWATIWGGGKNPAYQSSLECLCAFENMDEAFLTFDKGIQAQMAVGHPCMKQLKIYKDLTTGMETSECSFCWSDTEIHVRPYPHSVPPSMFADEYFNVPAFESCFGSTSPKEGDVADQNKKLLKKRDRWAFNFRLSEQDMATLQDPSRFSFVKQFPKCSMWLSHPSKTAHWMSFEMGVLEAVKGQSSMGKPKNVVHQTSKYTSLHAAFADMEDMIVLPKSWIKK